MISITYPPSADGTIIQETRVIIEIINDYTFVVEKAFPRVNELPDYILDFKFVVV